MNNLMEKLFLLVVFIQLFACSLHAQKFDVSINAGTSLTFIPDFNDYFMVANDGLCVPGLIAPANSVSPITFAPSTSQTNAKFGLFVDFDFGIKLSKKLKLSFSAGLLQMKYSYNAIIEGDSMPSVDLGSIVQDYGNTDLAYIQLKPIGVSSGFFDNKLNLKFGLLFNILVKSNYSNYVILYSEENNGSQTFDNIDKVYFSSIRKMNNILYGADLRVGYKIFRYFGLFISGQYYFNSIYNNKKSPYFTLYECRPFLLKMGVAWTF